MFFITGVIYEISYHWGHFSVQSESMNCKTHELAVRSFILVQQYQSNATKIAKKTFAIDEIIILEGTIWAVFDVFLNV